jgi:TM2 domain-containing membrane protein YozV
MRSRDVVALVFGLLFTGVAAAALWQAVTGSLPWSQLKTVVPLALVVVGVLGLALSRRP